MPSSAKISLASQYFDFTKTIFELAMVETEVKILTLPGYFIKLKGIICQTIITK